MSVLTIITEQFQEAVLESKQPVLIDFWASWCGPCHMMAPLVEELAKEHPEIKVGKVNVDEEPSLAQQFGVNAIPALILFQNGSPIARSIGVKPKHTIEGMIP